MKRFKIVAILLSFIVLLMACTNEEDQITDIRDDAADQQNTESSRTLPSRSDFENLDKESSLEELVEQFGNYGVEGSGILRHVWMLDDGSKAELIFNSKGKIEFIYIVSDDSSERIYDREDS